MSEKFFCIGCKRELVFIELLFFLSKRVGSDSLLMIRVVHVIGWAIFLRAFVASFDVGADFIVATAHTGRALIHILTRSIVAGQTITRRAGALIRSMRILAHSHAQVGWFMHFTFVDVFARAIVCAQMVTGFAGTPIRAPIIDATLWTKARRFRAFVNVNAGLLIVSVPLEAFLAFASIRTDRIRAFRIAWANLSFWMKDILNSWPHPKRPL